MFELDGEKMTRLCVLCLCLHTCPQLFLPSSFSFWLHLERGEGRTWLDIRISAGFCFRVVVAGSARGTARARELGSTHIYRGEIPADSAASQLSTGRDLPRARTPEGVQGLKDRPTPQEREQGQEKS